MSTTVRVEEDVKAELDRLQGLVQAETGERLSASDLLARLLRFASRHPGEFMSATEAAWRPPTRDELGKAFARVKDLRVRTDVTRIDEALYGGKP